MIRKLVVGIALSVMAVTYGVAVADKDSHGRFHASLEAEHKAFHRDREARHRSRHEVDVANNNRTFRARGNNRIVIGSNRSSAWPACSNPPGWSRGRKVGWDGRTVPPGRAKDDRYYMMWH